MDTGGPRQRSVIAALALDAGRLVPVGTLIDRVWGQDPPPRVRHALHAYIARIRKASVLVVHRSGAYLLEIDPDHIDAHRFRGLVELAGNRDCPDRQRLTLFSKAFDLWRGPPLADLPGEWAMRVRQAWQQRYLAAVQLWATACLRLGDPHSVVVRLTELAGEFPFVEPLGAVLMRALHAAGRSSDALVYYTKLRHRLVAELGVDPGPDLRRAHAQILAGGEGPELRAGGSAPGPASGRTVGPRPASRC